MFGKRFVFDLTDCCIHHFSLSVDLFGKISNVTFTDGCPGYTRILASEFEGCTIQEAIAVCDLGMCGGEMHECSERLCIAIKQKLIWLKENLD